MSNLTWRLDNTRKGAVRLTLSGGTAAEEAAVLELVVSELGNRATVQPSGESSYNITLAQDYTYNWLYCLLWGFLLHKHGIPVIL